MLPTFKVAQSDKKYYLNIFHQNLGLILTLDCILHLIESLWYFHISVIIYAIHVIVDKGLLLSKFTIGPIVISGIPMGPYTLQDGIWGFQEIMQAKNNETLTLPDAVPKGWTDVRDDCYNAPYMCKWLEA